MVLSTFNLEGKVALVTGCNTGLGQGMALGLARRVVISSALTVMARMIPKVKWRRWVAGSGRCRPI